jgi:Tol biopolymer transport system component
VRAGASCVVLVLALLASASSASPAEATFPGRQGLIAYYREAGPCRLDSEGGTVCRKGIWSSRLDGSGERWLTAVWGGRPSWSPDGRLIAHVRPSGLAGMGELWVMKGDGSGARKLLSATARSSGPVRDSVDPEALVPSWSRDGSFVVVAAARFDQRKQSAGPQPLVLAVPVKGGELRDLLTLPRGRDGYAHVVSPQLSPNGKLIAFIYGTAGTQALYVAWPDGSHRKRISIAHSAYGRSLDWSPDSRRIVFLRQVSLDDGGYAELYLINANGTGLRRLTNEKLSTENESPAWSPDGRQIIFKSGADSLNKPGQYDGTENRFAVINADGSGLHLVGPGALNCGVKNPLLSQPACYASDPSWQPR